MSTVKPKMGGQQLGGEQRREQEERRHAGQHEDEAGHLLGAEAGDQLVDVHQPPPTRVGIAE